MDKTKYRIKKRFGIWMVTRPNRAFPFYVSNHPDVLYRAIWLDRVETGVYN